MRDLHGATVLLTGASGGLAGPIARTLSAAGARIVLSGRNRDALDRLAAELSGAETAVVEADLGRRDEALGLVAEAERALGPIDVLVNNAGIEITKPFVELADADVDAMVALNLVTPVLLTRSVLPGMLERGRGHVVNIASMSGKVGVSCNEIYAATKAGLIGATRSLRAEFRDAPVGFSAVSPGFVADVGMYDRMTQRDGVKASRLAGTADPEKVGAATLRAIRDDLPEVIVNGTPIRPALAFGVMAPRLFERLSGSFGVNEMFEAVAARRKSAA